MRLHTLLALLSALMLSEPAAAADLAVLDFDGYVLEYPDVQMISQGLRDAALEEGSFTPLDEFEISDRLAAGREQALADAREAMAAGRKALSLGQTGTALQHFKDSLAAHEAANSAFGKRAEMADAHYFTGVAMVQVGRGYEANAHFERAERLFSGYLTARAPSPSPQIQSLYKSATSGVASDEREVPLTSTIQALGEGIRVDAVVVGWADETGTIYGRLIQGSRVVGEVTTRSTDEIPPYPGHPIYGEIMRELLANADASGSSSAGSTFAPLPSLPPVADSGGSDAGFAPLPTWGGNAVDLDEDPYAENEVEAPPEEEKRQRGTRMKKNQVGKIKTSGRIRYNNEPITRKWWFWTATGAVVVGGGTTAAVLALSGDDEPDEASSDSSVADPYYNVTLETGE
jgi:tetratricopeptide (TPR) repeat protein